MAKVGSKERKMELDVLVCCGTDDVAGLAGLIAEGAKTNFADPLGLTPLMEAARSGSIQCLKILAPLAGEGVNASEDRGVTALMFAAVRGHARCVEALLPYANQKATCFRGKSALMWAAQGGHEACVSLLAQGSDVQARDVRGMDALMIAAKSGNVECVKVLLPLSSPMHVSSLGRDALSYGSGAGAARVVALLAPLSLAGRSDAEGRTALMRAVSFEDGEIGADAAACVELLLGYSDPLAVDFSGITALGWAAHCGSASGMQSLIPVTDLDATTNRGETILMLAASGGSVACVRLATEWSDSDARDVLGGTAIDHAREQSRVRAEAFLKAWIMSQSEKSQLADQTEIVQGAAILPSRAQRTSL